MTDITSNMIAKKTFKEYTNWLMDNGYLTYNDINSPQRIDIKELYAIKWTEFTREQKINEILK